MKLKRPQLKREEYPWSQNVDTVWTGKHSCIVCHPTNTPNAIAQAKAIAVLPEVMDFLEAIARKALNGKDNPKRCGSTLWDIEAMAEDALRKMGYTEEEELPEPEPKPDSES